MVPLLQNPDRRTSNETPGSSFHSLLGGWGARSLSLSWRSSIFINPLPLAIGFTLFQKKNKLLVHHSSWIYITLSHPASSTLFHLALFTSRGTFLDPLFVDGYCNAESSSTSMPDTLLSVLKSSYCHNCILRGASTCFGLGVSSLVRVKSHVPLLNPGSTPRFLGLRSQMINSFLISSQ